MKKLFLLSALTCLAVLAKAQSSAYHAFKVDLGLGYAIPAGGSSDGVKAGATFTVEPHYRLSDAVAIGFRFEGAGLGYENGADSDPEISILTSYCPTVQYYLAAAGFRPFFGAGAGLFSQSSLNVNSGTGNINVPVEGATRFGFFPRLGFEVGHFRMSGEYNILGNSSNYAAFKIGFFLGGGKK